MLKQRGISEEGLKRIANSSIAQPALEQLRQDMNTSIKSLYEGLTSEEDRLTLDDLYDEFMAGIQELISYPANEEY